MPSRNSIEIIINARDNTGGVLQNVAGNLQTIGGVALGAVTAGLAAATAATVAFGAQSLSTFTSFQQGINETFTLLPGITEETMSAMEADVQRFMEATGRVSEETLPALYQALSAGVPQDNVFEFLELANRAAVGGVTELETAVDGISSVINSYGSDVLSATEASDLMFTAVRLGKTTFDELSASLFNVVPTASALGVSFGDVTAAMATITSQGVPTSVATTQLRQMFVELGDAGTDVGQIFQDIAGTSFSDFIAQGGSTADAMQLMMQASEDLGIPLQQMFGSVEAANAALALTGTSMETFVSNTNEMVNSAGATEAAFDQMNDTLQFSLNLLAGRFQSALISVGRLLAPFAQPLVETFSIFFAILADATESGFALSDWLEELPGFLRPVGVLVGRFGAWLFNVADAMGIVINALENGADPLEAFGYLLRRAIGNEVGLAIQGLIGSVFGFFNALNNLFAPLMEWLSLWIRLEDIIVVLGIAIAAVVIPAIVGIATALAPVLALFGAMVVGVALLRNAWESNFLGIRDIILNDFLPGLQSALATVQEFFGGLFEAFQEDGFEGAATFIQDNFITPMMDSIGNINWGQVATTILEALGTALETAVSWATWIWEHILVPMFNNVVAAIDNVDWGQVASTILNAIGTGLLLWADWINFVTDNILTPIFDFLMVQAETIDWEQLGRDIVAFIFSPFTSGGGGDGMDWGEVFNAWMGALGNFASTVFNFQVWVITNVLAPLISGMLQSIAEVDWSTVGKHILHFIGNAITTTVKFMVWVRDNILEPILENAQAAIEEVEWFDVGAAIVNAIGAAITASFDFVGWIISSIFSPANDNASSASDSTDWSGVGGAMMSGVGDYYKNEFNFNAWFGVEVLAPLVAGAVAAIGAFNWSGVGDGMMESIGESLPNMITWTTENIIRPIRDTLVGFNPMADVNRDIGQGGVSNAGNTGNFGNPLNPLQLGLRAGQAFGNFIFGRQFGGQTGTSPIVVGESGRELFVPDTPGTVIPNQQTEDLLNGSQSPSVTINMYISGGVSDEVASDAAYKLKRELTAQGFQI